MRPSESKLGSKKAAPQRTQSAPKGCPSKNAPTKAASRDNELPGKRSAVGNTTNPCNLRIVVVHRNWTPCCRQSATAATLPPAAFGTPGERIVHSQSTLCFSVLCIVSQRVGDE